MNSLAINPNMEIPTDQQSRFLNKDDVNFPYWRVIDEKHPIVKKLKLDENQIKKRRVDEGIPY